MKWIDEFKEFALKGSVVDLAVGFIIGAAFQTIVKSLVDDVIMPPLGLLTGGIDFSSMHILLKEGSEGVEAVTLNYGLFINNIVTFLIVALVLFFAIKWMNKLRRKEDPDPAPKPEPEPPKDIVLLTEIRDILKSRE